MKICEFCGNSFDSPTSRFCSFRCRNIYNARQQRKNMLGKRCPVCGHYGRDRISDFCDEHAPDRRFWTQSEIEFLVKNYANMGPDEVSQHIDRTREQVQLKANNLGLTLTKDTARRLVHDKAAEYMRKNNPSRLPGASERLAERGRRDIQKNVNFLKGRAAFQKGSPSRLEQRLFEMLDDLAVAYEAYAIIKPKFIVDAKVGSVIIQVDGEYWHGHPRFEPLTDRQKAQQRRDQSQDAYLTACGFTVVRIWENDLSAPLLRSILYQMGAL